MAPRDSEDAADRFEGTTGADGNADLVELEKRQKVTVFDPLPGVKKTTAKVVKATTAAPAQATKLPATPTTRTTVTVTVTAPSNVVTQIVTTIVSTIISTGTPNPSSVTCIAEATAMARARIARQSRPHNQWTVTETILDPTATTTTTQFTTMVDALFGHVERRTITLGSQAYLYPIIPSERARVPFCTDPVDPATTTTTTNAKTTTTSDIPEATVTLTDGSPLDPTVPTQPTATDSTTDSTDLPSNGNYGLNFCEQVFGLGSIRTTCADICSFFLESNDAANIMACNKVCKVVAKTTGSFTTSCTAIFTDILTDTGSAPSNGNGDGSIATELPEPTTPETTVTVIYETIWVDPTPTETFAMTLPTSDVSIEDPTAPSTSAVVVDFPTDPAVEVPEKTTTTKKKTTTTKTGPALLVVSKTTSTPTLIPILVAEQNNKVIAATDVDDPLIGRSGAFALSASQVWATLACVAIAAYHAQQRLLVY